MAWEIIGNAGTNPATNFLGTTDNEPLVIRTNGAERLRIDSAGNIGIGTTSPGDLLHLYRNGAAYLRTEANNGAGSYRAYGIGAGSDYNFHISDLTDGADRLVINWSTGNVGIGTTSPGDLLHLYRNGAAYLRTEANNGAGSYRAYGIGAGSDYNFHISDLTDGADRLVINWSTGNVGIGTTSPGAKLEVSTASGTGIVATSQSSFGISGGGGDIGVYAHNLTTPANVVYLATKALAGDFIGNVRISGDVLLTGADCAEEFDIAEAAEIDPGTVMVLDQDGALHQSQKAYDKRVAGVISGAGDYKSCLILDRRQSHDNRLPVALVGKVYCKVDAQYASIEVGDLLTTSPTPGYAMKADDPLKAFGSVIGKALQALQNGQQLVPILVALQ